MWMAIIYVLVNLVTDLSYRVLDPRIVWEVKAMGELKKKPEDVKNDVSFSLASGEILGLVGESGSGKSTLLKAAIGLLGTSGLVTRGDIYYMGQNILDIPEKENEKRVAEVLEQCGLSSEFAKRYPHEVSGLPDEIINEPKQAYTRKLVDAVFL